MENVLWVSIIITVVYICISLLDIMYLQKAPLNIKSISKDSIIVYLSVITGIYGMEYFKMSTTGPPALTVFTDAPNF